MTVESPGKSERLNKQRETIPFLETLLEKVKKELKTEDIEEETARMVERIVVLMIATKHINLWMRQLEMKRKEICQLAGLMGLEEVK